MRKPVFTLRRRCGRGITTYAEWRQRQSSRSSTVDSIRARAALARLRAGWRRRSSSRTSIPAGSSAGRCVRSGGSVRRSWRYENAAVSWHDRGERVRDHEPRDHTEYQVVMPVSSANALGSASPTSPLPNDPDQRLISLERFAGYVAHGNLHIEPDADNHAGEVANGGFGVRDTSWSAAPTACATFGGGPSHSFALFVPSPLVSAAKSPAIVGDVT